MLLLVTYCTQQLLIIHNQQIMSKEKSVIIVETDGNLRKSIGALIKTVRRQNNLSAETVARKIGISRVALTQIENGRNNLSAVMIWKLACILGSDISVFFPKVPEGFGLSRSDLNQLEKEDEKVASWATQLFGPVEKDS